jgi:hypothetical protein
MAWERREESTEGDLDPDLTEEAGYMGWDPPRRSLWWLVYRLGLVILLLAMFGSVLVVFLR